MVQLPPFSFLTVSLWLAMTAIILLITAQLASSYDGPATLLINAERLKYAALIMSLLFLASVAVDIYEIITST
jgi:hypothetical protein